MFLKKVDFNGTVKGNVCKEVGKGEKLALADIKQVQKV